MNRFHRVCQRGNVRRNIIFGICALVALLIIVGIGVPRVMKRVSIQKAVAQAQSDIARRDQAKARAEAEKKVRESSTPVETKSGNEPRDVSSPEKKKGPQLRGRVVKASDESPIEGAVISAARIPALSAGKISIVDTSLSNADGTFDIPQMQVDMAEGGTETSVFLVSAEGFESQMIYAGYKETDDIVFKLGPGASITGRIVNEAKAPVGNVAILSSTIQNLDKAGTPEFFKPQIFSHAVTAEDGSFTIKGLRTTESYRFNARAPQYDPFISEETAAGASGVEWILKRNSGRIFGKVTNADGTPTKKAFIQAYYQDSMGGSVMEMMAKIRHTTTMDDGTFELESLKPGAIMVMVMRSAGNATGGSAMRNVTMKEKEEKEINIQMPALLTVKGKAVDDDTEQPLAGVNVSTEAPSGMGQMFGIKMPSFVKAPKNPGVLTGGDGTFTLDGVAPMNGTAAMIFFTPPPGMVAMGTGQMGNNMIMIPMNTKSGAFDEVIIHFRKTGRIHGIVYFSGGTNPAADVTVELSASEQNYSKSGKSGKDGKFSIEVPPAVDLIARASTETAAVSAKARYNPAEKNEDVVLTLKNFGNISGIVKDSAGNPVKAIPVTATGALKKDDSGNPMGRMFGRGASATSAIDGTFTISKVEPGEITLSAQVGSRMFSMSGSKEGENYSSAAPVSVTLAEGENKSGVEIILSEGEPIDGLVTDQEKNPISGASIQAYGNNQFKQATTDAEGKFTLKGIGPDQKVQLNVTHPEYSPANKQNIGPENSPVEFVLKPRMDMELQVTYAKGGAVKSFKYTMYRSMRRASWSPAADLPNGEVRDDADGVTTLKGMMPGNYRVEVTELVDTGASGRSGSAEFKVDEADDKKATVEVTLDTGRKIAGTVIRGENGPPVVGAEVSASRVNSAFASMQGMQTPPALSATTDGEGAFALEPLLPGEIEISVASAGLFVKDKVYVTVLADQDPAPLTIVLMESGSIFGTVTDFDGKPVPNASLSLTNFSNTNFSSFFGQSNAKTIKTDAQGTYRFEGLGPADYTLTLTSDLANIKDSRTVQLTAGESEQSDFDFSALISISGVVTINGKPMSQAENTIYIWEEGGATARKTLNLDADGKYTVTAKPGDHSVYLLSKAGNSFGWTPGQYALVSSLKIPATPREQRHDITLQFIDATVALVFPSEDQFVSGNVAVAQIDSPQVPAPGLGAAADSASVNLKNLTPGRYKATFHSDNEEWYGTSEPVQLTVGGENILVVDVKKPGFKKQVGEWKQSEVTKEFADFDIDITPHVDMAAPYDVIFNYGSGNEALIVDSVALLVNGSEVAIDKHQGWAGFSKRDNIYRLNLSNFRSGASYVLRCRYRANGSSNGQIFLAR